MKRYGEEFKLTETFLNDISVYMDNNKRERVHFELAPCAPEKFLRRYLELDPDFETVLKSEFSITDAIARTKNRKTCVVCGRSFECRPSRNIVTCSQECRSEYNRRNHTGLRHSQEAKEKMSKSRKALRNCKDLQENATRAAQKSPKSGKFVENVHAKDWHLVSPEGRHYYFHSLRNWLRENGMCFLGVSEGTKEFDAAISGISRAKRSAMGTVPPEQRPCCTYKGWRVVPTETEK